MNQSLFFKLCQRVRHESVVHKNLTEAAQVPALHGCGFECKTTMELLCLAHKPQTHMFPG